MLDQPGLVIQRPGAGAAGLAGVGPVGPNRAGRALAIIRLACGALTGKLIGPAPATVSRMSLAGTDSCALNAPGAGEPSSTLASRSLGATVIPAPPASRMRSVSQATGEENSIHPNGPGASPRIKREPVRALPSEASYSL